MKNVSSRGVLRSVLDIPSLLFDSAIAIVLDPLFPSVSALDLILFANICYTGIQTSARGFFLLRREAMRVNL